MHRRPALIAAVAVVLSMAAPAWAHVEVKPDEAPRGATVDLAFHVPNEKDDASTIKVEIRFPTDHPIPSATPKEMPGWIASVQRSGGVVTGVTWDDGLLPPGGELDFVVTVGPLPTDTDRLVFGALQTYDDGEVVRWIEEPSDGGEEPEHPAPVLRLVGAAPPTTDATLAPTSSTLAVTTTTSTAVGEADGDDDDGDNTVLFAALAAALAAGAGVLAYVLNRRRAR